MHDSSYSFWKGVNWRAIPAWVCGWAPTIGGLVVSVRDDMDPPRALLQLYYMAFLIGQYSITTTVLGSN
jgi:NCS1 family nucleobase:cation symporter-1